MDKLQGGVDSEYEERKRKEILQQYENSLIHKYNVPEHGIQSVNLECAFPIEIGKQPDPTCGGEDGNILMLILNTLLIFSYLKLFN